MPGLVDEKTLILRGAVAELPGDSPHQCPAGPTLFLTAFLRVLRRLQGHATGHWNSVEGASATQAGPADPARTWLRLPRLRPKEQSLAPGKGNSGGEDTLGGGGRAALSFQPSEFAAATIRLRRVFYPAAGEALPCGSRQNFTGSLKPRVLPLHGPPAGLCLLGC